MFLAAARYDYATYLAACDMKSSDLAGAEKQSENFGVVTLGACTPTKTPREHYN